MSQQKKTILITGCSTGIGFCAAKILHERGYQVFASVKQLKDKPLLESLGITCVHLDLSQQNSIEQGLTEVLNITGGRLDYLFNNGAYGQPGAIEDLPTEILREQFEANFFGWHHLTRLVLKVMREQGYGRIVQNSSVLGFICMPYRGAYNASKYALEGLTDTLRLELKDTPIKISILEPGPIRSAFRKNGAFKFKSNIDWQSSIHYENYLQQLARLEDTEKVHRFCLEPEAVVTSLIHALESDRPKVRYRITFPTHLFNVLKRIIPAKWLDSILAKG
ncbi:SDR family oxidoreductase [Aliikangiella maris]|uniref:SDR family oxidoreductase n=2 Tax=Aliikangiella maris TaxID=3162458 RepID=A0ABV2BUI8_9GAMM